MDRLIKFIKKPLCIDESKYNLSKNQCLLSVAFIIFDYIMYCLALVLLKNSFFYQEAIHLEHFTLITQFKWGLIFFSLSIIPLFIFLYFTNQKLTTIGIKKEKILISLLISMPLIASVYSEYISSQIPLFEVLIKSIFYILFIGFHEEILLRGFIWVRLQTLLGKKMGIIITGIIFSLYHAPLQLIWFDKSINYVLFHGSVPILSGIGAHIIFGYIYSRNENILLPTLIHGLLDLKGSILN